MPLRQFNSGISCSWQQQLSITGYQPRRQGLDSDNYNLSGLDLDRFDELYSKILTLDPGDDATIDLTAWDNELLGVEGLAFTRVIWIMVHVLSDEGIARVTPGDTNPLKWFFTTATDGFDLGPHECFGFGGDPDGDGYLVDPTQCTLKVENMGAATEPMRVKVTIQGGTSLTA
jgi:hypothetical protein